MRVLIGLVMLVLALCAAACATPNAAPTISDQERCMRFSGLWEAGTCWGGSGGGGSM